MSYIKREQIVREALSLTMTDGIYGRGLKRGIDLVLAIVNRQDNADVEEIKRGKWEWDLQGIGKINCRCTNCQEWFPIKYEDLDEYGSPERETKRCPNCGAYMQKSDE